MAQNWKWGWFLLLVVMWVMECWRREAHSFWFAAAMAFAAGAWGVVIVKTIWMGARTEGRGEVR
jgi:hypothetical protein